MSNNFDIAFLFFLFFFKLDTSPGFCSTKHEWTWDEKLSSSSIRLSEYNLNVKFHPVYSTGTAVVKGSRPLEKGRHHFWEILMITQIYGTDVVSLFLSAVELQLLFTTQFMHMLFFIVSSDGWCGNCKCRN